MLFSVYTLGCKLNQLETEAIIDSFCREGFSFIKQVPKTGEPRLMIINTCTVTSMAEQKARRFIRRLLREEPGICLLVTGCYAQMEQDVLSALDRRRLFVVPGEKKDRIMDLPSFLNKASVGETGPSLPDLIASWIASLSAPTVPDASFRFKPETFTEHSRAFLKIQDGCDNRCAYCRVSLARGKSRSLGAAEVLKELESLQQRGFAEVVLTGVNIFQYRDAEAALAGLPGLLDFLLSHTETIRIRLSSIEPGPDSGSPGYRDLIKVLANPRIRPHFHISLQSASSKVLKKMERPYSPEDVEELVLRLRSVRDDPFVACDIIAGFPGETTDEFEKTFAFCEKIGFAWIHAFPFSPRPGTAACNFAEKVPEREAARRVALLTELAKKGRRDYLERWEGRDVEAVVEAGRGGTVAGLSENYIRLLIGCGKQPIPAAGSLVRCRIGKVPEDHSDIQRIPAQLIHTGFVKKAKK